MSETISPNTTIAQYTIVSKIDEGGVGEVWRARDGKLDLMTLRFELCHGVSQTG